MTASSYVVERTADCVAFHDHGTRPAPRSCVAVVRRADACTFSTCRRTATTTSKQGRRVCRRCAPILAALGQ